MNDYKKLETLFQQHGFTDFKMISPKEIVVTQWVRMKCEFGCASFGKKASCPPNTPSVSECRKFFDNEYPAMLDVDANLAIIRSSGYKVVSYFTLPESSWWDSYYNPLADRLQPFRKKYATEPKRIEMIDAVEMEIDIYRKYSSYYGYVFFLMQHTQSE